MINLPNKFVLGFHAIFSYANLTLLHDLYKKTINNNYVFPVKIQK